MTELQTLLDRVRGASGPLDERFNLELAMALGLRPDGAAPDAPYTAYLNQVCPHVYCDVDGRQARVPTDNWSASLDAALALVERVLPGWGCKVIVALGGGAHAEVFHADGRAYDHNGEMNVGLNEWLERGDIHCATPALAMVGALLSALIAGRAATEEKS